MSALRNLAGPLLIACMASIGMSSSSAAELAFDLKIERGRLPENMRLIRVVQGDVVTLRWSADQPVVLHLHGYDIEKRVDPGAVATMRFAASATGRFPVHIHADAPPRGDHASEEAPLADVEVYPR